MESSARGEKTRAEENECYRSSALVLFLFIGCIQLLHYFAVNDQGKRRYQRDYSEIIPYIMCMCTGGYPFLMSCK